MSIETDLYSTLSGNAGVSALVSTRIYPNLAPESTANPCIVYNAVSESRIDTLPGTSDARRSMIQINCYGDTYASAKSVAEAVYTALDGNGYMESAIDLYDFETQSHQVGITWRFIAAS